MVHIGWVTNILMPEASIKLGVAKGHEGGWLSSALNELKKGDVKVSIFTVSPLVKKTFIFDLNNVSYYIIPGKKINKYSKNLELVFVTILKKINIDIMHVWGSEYPHSYSCVCACKNLNIPSIISIQGLVSKCSEHYTDGLPMNVIYGKTLYELLRFRGVNSNRRDFQRRGIYEISALQETDNIIGRTEWDRINSFHINEDATYHKCNECLRESFYKNHWNILNCEKESIFVTQASYPLKGFHILLKGLALVKQKYPNMILYVAGYNTIFNNTGLRKFTATKYSKYLRNIIAENSLEDNIVFCGPLDESAMVRRYLSCQVFVTTSSLENSSNSLAEAMLLGVPSIASNVGGTNSIAEHKSSALLYPFSEYEVLARYIMDIFENEELSLSLSFRAQELATKMYNKDSNNTRLLNIYSEILARKETKHDSI